MGLVFLLAVCATGALKGQCPDGTPPPCAGEQPSRPVVLIVPFENRSRDTADAYLAQTLTEDLESAFSSTHAVRVVEPGSTLRATHVVRGSVQREGEVVRVTARVERGGTGEVRWARRFELPTSESQALHDSLVDQVAAVLGLPDRIARPRPRITDPATYDLWLRAHYLVPRRRQEDEAGAAALLGRALARDSAFAPAWADFARVLRWARRFGFAIPGIPTDSLLPRMLDASERAVLLDSTNVDTWRLRASIATIVDPTSSTVGLAALRHALALDSMDAQTWDDYALALEESGDPDGAAAAWRHAVTLDPRRPYGSYAQHWLWARQYDSAAAWAERAVTEDPTLMFLREGVGEAALARGQLGRAEAAYEAALRLGAGPDQVRSLSGLAIVAAGLGDTARARTLIARAEAVTDSTMPTLHASVSIAEAYVAIGAPGRALEWLGRYQPRGDLHFQLHLARDATLDALRSDPRFRRLLTRSPTPDAPR